MAQREELIMAVTIPAGLRPGDRFTVAAPDGRNFEVIVPSGVAGGQSINVAVDAGVTTGSRTTAAAAGAAPPTNTDPRSSRVALGAAGAAAVAGTLLLGPITGIVVAGAALYATTRDDEVGHAARTAGVAACQLYDKAKEHGIVDGVKNGVYTAAQRAQQINNEYRITEQLAAGARELDERHQIRQRVAEGAMAAAVRAPGAAAQVLRMLSSASNSTSAGATGTGGVAR